MPGSVRKPLRELSCLNLRQPYDVGMTSTPNTNGGTKAPRGDLPKLSQLVDGRTRVQNHDLVSLCPALRIQICTHPGSSYLPPALTPSPSLGWALATQATVQEDMALFGASVLSPGSGHGEAQCPAHSKHPTRLSRYVTRPLCPQLALEQGANDTGS